LQLSTTDSDSQAENIEIIAGYVFWY
jgi:hypothetical protein